MPTRASAKAYFIRRPYPVYQNDPTTMMILTHTNYLVDRARIYWSTDGDQSGSASMKVRNSNEHPNRHDYKVISYTWPHGTFKPNTRVYYTVKVTCSWCGDAKYSGDFYTAYRHDRKTIAFFAVSDTHADSAQKFKPYEKVMEKMWDVSRHGVERLMLVVGDFIREGGGTPYFPEHNPYNKYYFSQSKSHSGANDCYKRMPILASIGNHDFTGFGDDPDNFKYYYQGWPYYMYKQSSGVSPLDHLNAGVLGDEYLDKAFYSCDYGPIHFISIANQDDDNPDIKPAPNNSSKDRFSRAYLQYTWLERDLKKNAKPWTVVMFHAPIFDGVGKHEVRYWLIPLFERYKVTAIFQGHHHWFWYGRSSGINAGNNGTAKIAYTLLGGGGYKAVWDMTEKMDYGEYLNHRYNFARISVEKAQDKGADAYQMVSRVYLDDVKGSGDKRKKNAKKKKNWKWTTKDFILSDVKHY